jgi:adenine/guanine phosphoribosyltransferase-like PRPP-binding protein
MLIRLMNLEAIRKRQLARGLLCQKLSDKQSLVAFTNNLARTFVDDQITKVAVPEAMGFALASAPALRLECGLVLLMKSAPDESDSYDSESFEDYSGVRKSLFLRIATVKTGDSALLIDDYIESGAQVRAACALLTRQGIRIVGVACLGTNTSCSYIGLPKIVKIDFN